MESVPSRQPLFVGLTVKALSALLIPLRNTGFLPFTDLSPSAALAQEYGKSLYR